MDVREKLVEQAISHFWYGVSHDIFSEPVTTYAKLAIEALKKENGVTVQEWISVDDRLPEPKHEFDARNWYLVALSNGVVKELAYEFHNNSVFGYGWRETAYPVSHWMPLPKPPKGE